MENGVRGELVKLHPMDEQESSEEFVSGQREAALEECKEDHGPSGRRSRKYLSTWPLHLLLVLRNAPLLAQLVQLPLGDEGAVPIAGSFLHGALAATGGDALLLRLRLRRRRRRLSHLF